MTEIKYEHQPPGRLTLSRDVTMAECPWLERDYAKGETVVRYTGATYGCIGAGVACSETGGNPFFELPRDALAEHADAA